MSILITGGAGFIGSHLVERLLQQTDVPIVCVDNFNDYYDPGLKRSNVAVFENHPQVSVVEGSFCDAELVHQLFAAHRFNCVMHLGAYAGVRPSVARPLVYQKANVEGTLVLLEAVRTHPVERFVFTSSSTVYGRGAQAPFREDDPLGVPMSPYGATKIAAEMLCLTYHDLHQTPVVCLRPFSVYGPRLRPDLAMSIFAGAIARGEPLPLFGDGTIRRDFTHVSDICSGIISAMTAEGAIGQQINLGHDQPIEIRALIEMLEKALGKQAIIDHQHEKPGEMRVTHADLSKAKRLLGYQPQVPLAEGVCEYVDWFRAHHGL